MARLNRNQIEMKRRERITAQIRAEAVIHGWDEEEILSIIEDEIEEELDMEAAERAEMLEMYSEPEDTPCIESGRDNCDDWGTGEGQFHGRI
jgi:hypothetical protein